MTDTHTALADLLAILTRMGGYQTQEDQLTLRRARELLVARECVESRSSLPQERVGADSHGSDTPIAPGPSGEFLRAALRWAAADRLCSSCRDALVATHGQPTMVFDRAWFALQDACAAEREALEQLKAAAREASVELAGAAASAPSWVDALSPAQLQRAVMALRDLTIGGEFAAWMHSAEPELPLAANREYEEAVALMRDMVGGGARAQLEPAQPTDGALADNSSGLREALERIRDYQLRDPVDEWAEAAAFGEVQAIAADALAAEGAEP